MAKGLKVVARPKFLDERRVYNTNPLYQQAIDTLGSMREGQCIEIPKNDLTYQGNPLNVAAFQVGLRHRQKKQNLSYRIKSYFDKQGEILYVWKEEEK